MAAVQFHCPHCRGMFQVDSSLAGVQVSCPHCRQVTTVPDVASTPGFPPPPAPPPGGGIFPPGIGAGPPAAPRPPASPFDFAAPSNRPAAPFEVPPFGSGSPFGKSPSRFDFLQENEPPPPSGPKFDPFAPWPTPAPTPPLTPVVPTPATSKFACPLCRGLFQVDASMAGQQVTCPHCRDVVTLPSFGPAPSPASTPIPAPSPTVPVRAPSPPAPAGNFPPAPSSPAAPKPVPFVPPPAGGAKTSPTPSSTPTPAPTPSLYPPGYTPPGKDKPTTDTAPKPAPAPPAPATPGQAAAKASPASPFYPPGFSPPGTAATTSAPVPATAPVPAKAPVPSTAAPSTPVPSTPAPSPKPVPSAPPPEKGARQPSETELPAVDVAALLPPSTGPVEEPTTEAKAPRPIPLGEAGVRAKASVDELLPPGVEPTTDASGESGDGASGAVVSVENLPEGVVVLPAADGGFVAVRESVKTVQFGGEEVELRKLSPEEKARKRLFRTLFMVIFGLAFLTVMAVVLVMLNG